MASTSKVPIQSTAGAIAVKNEKGQFVMEKVKVQRYVAGKRPDYAPASSDEEEDEELIVRQKFEQPTMMLQSRIRGEVAYENDEDEDDERAARMRRRRAVPEPEILARSDTEEDLLLEDDTGPVRIHREGAEDDDEEEEELSEEEIERRRNFLRQKMMSHNWRDEEILAHEEEKAGSEEESSEYESEYESADEEDAGPRLKPVFVRKKDRVTIQEKEQEERRKHELEMEAKRLAEERRKTTLKIVEQEVKKEMEAELRSDPHDLDAVDTDDEKNVEEDYEAWKVRELRRMKRDREERDQQDKEKMEIDMVHSMTEDERRKWLKDHPRVVINKASKGKYRFLQKYYHRGAFFMHDDDDIYKRDYSEPTLEDHFDKTVLPKVMQVKNFGRSGRTKYTHLVDQDTTAFDSPWVSDAQSNLKFHTTRGGGTKQVFDRPSSKKLKSHTYV